MTIHNKTDKASFAYLAAIHRARRVKARRKWASASSILSDATVMRGYLIHSGTAY